MNGLPEPSDRIDVQPGVERQLPGPSRKRTQTAYGYRLIYRNEVPDAAGCVLLWEVTGGREPYQIALELERSGGLRLHCTCADAIYRAESQGRFCKHVLGLLNLNLALHPQSVRADSSTRLGA